MIFTYWSGDTGHLTDFVRDWSESYAAPLIFDDVAVEIALSEIDLEWPSIYRGIRIPACRSDVARFALLYKFGGCYIDAHTGRPDIKVLAEVFSRLSNVDIVVAIKPHADNPPITHVVQNGAILARKKSDMVAAILSSLVENLRLHFAKERGGGCRGGYNIAAMTGGWAVRLCLFRRDVPDLIPYPHYSGRISTLLMEGGEPQPFRFYQHYGYRKSGMHWSERQRCEPLFEIAAANGLSPVLNS